MSRIAAIAFVLVLGGCATPQGNQCDGWRPIALKQKTAMYIIDHDEQAAESILTHNEFGERIGCWKPTK